MTVYYINEQENLGIAGDVADALRLDPPVEGMTQADFRHVTEEEWGEWVLDARFEDGCWQQ